MVAALTATEVRLLAAEHGITPSKALGQNFVVDPNTVRRIVRLAEIQADDSVIEVGAGFGTMTRVLAEQARRVFAIELDRKIIPALAKVVAGLANVDVIQGDALKIAYSNFTAAGANRMVSNLPYNIATPLIAQLLEGVPQITDFVVVVQREAGERFAAAPGSKAYGAVSVLVAYHCTSKVLGRVPATVFWPVPNVESVQVRLTRHDPPVDLPWDKIKPVVRAAFGQRRKTIRNSLAAGLDRPPVEIEALLRQAGVDAGARAEQLVLPDFAAIAMQFWAAA